jgi:pimeloyl-ACP methyl ester carboxylesterase
MAIMRQDQVEIADGTKTVRLAFTEWGEPSAARVVVCVHGLTRNARDFDFLAQRLADHARIICFDVVGRGGSQWLQDPRRYDNLTYAIQLRLALARLSIEQVDWVGTSMGGLIGLILAAGPGTPIRRLILNDIGPFIPKSAMEFIKTYLGLDLSFRDLAELEQHLRQVHAPFGPLTDAQWRHLARHSSRQDGERQRLHYDPQIRAPFADWSAADVDLWPIYDAIRAPTLVLHGADSLLLSAETAQAMTDRGPKARLVTFPGVGHAPSLMADDQIRAVADWLQL